MAVVAAGEGEGGGSGGGGNRCGDVWPAAFLQTAYPV